MKKLSAHALRRSAAHIFYGSVMSLPLALQVQAETPSITDSIFGGETQASIGVGVAGGPRYMGSKDYRSVPVPVLSLSRGIFFVDTYRGLGLQWQSSSGFYISQSFFYDAGRDDRNNDFRPGANRLSGMGEVDSTATSILYLSQQLTPWLSVNGEAEFALDGGERGTRYRAGLEATVLNQSRDIIVLGLDVRAADHRYNQAYFGVTGQQSQQSRFTAFTPGGGLNQYALNANWTHKFDENWSTYVLVTASELGGKVEDSPLIERKGAVSAVTSISYTF